ncbi:MAG: hypothetical protein WCI87_07715 [Euryarchaeota archaeon]
MTGVPSAWFAGDGISLEQWTEERRLLNHPEEFEEPQEDRIIARYFCGVDLGKRRDPSTVAVLEQRKAPSGRAHYYVKHLKRFALKMLYTDIATTLKKMDAQLQTHAAKKGKKAVITWVLDCGGVGEGVAEMVEKAMPGAQIIKVYLTGGVNPTIDRREVHLPKAQMVSTLVALFDGHFLHLTKRSQEIEAIKEELQNYELRVSDEGRDSFGAFKTGQFDDLVTALALACWAGQAAQKGKFEPVRFWH